MEVLTLGMKMLRGFLALAVVVGAVLAVVGGPASSAPLGAPPDRSSAQAPAPSPVVAAAAGLGCSKSSQTMPAVVGSAAGPTGDGMWLTDQEGDVFNIGDAGCFGSLAATALRQPIVGMAATADGAGYWLVARDGGVFSFGDAKFYGSTGNIRLNQPIVGMAAEPGGGGYRFVAADGGVFDFGDAKFFGSTGSIRLNQPIVGMAATADGAGYWLVARDGGVFSFGDAKFFGSTGNIRLNQPIVGMAAEPGGGGYRFVAADGGVFDFGDATFAGSPASHPPPFPVTGLAATSDGRGYWIVSSGGAAYNYGDASPLPGVTGSFELMAGHTLTFGDIINSGCDSDYLAYSIDGSPATFLPQPDPAVPSDCHNAVPSVTVGPYPADHQVTLQLDDSGLPLGSGGCTEDDTYPSTSPDHASVLGDAPFVVYFNDSRCGQAPPSSPLPPGPGFSTAAVTVTIH